MNDDLADKSLEQLMDTRVVSAAMHEQDLADAPGDVTVISAQQIHEWGCRTIDEALSHVRGFYLSTDRSYGFLGIRGLSLPGDFVTRAVILINGHSIAESIYNMSGWLAQDFPVDLNLVERIEIVRGPSSALYGSSSVLATINVVTFSPTKHKGAGVRIETGSLGERKIGAENTFDFGSSASLLFATSIFNSAGPHDLYFPAFDSPATNYGHAIDANGEKGYHAFADFTWKNWEVLAVAGDRVRQQPISYGYTAFNDPGTSAEDSRGFVDISYSKDLPGDRNLSWHASYDAYRYRGIYHYVTASGLDDNRERDYGDWFGSKFTYRLPDWGRGYLTAGTETRIDLRTMENVADIAPVPKQILMLDHADRYAGFFLQQEWTLGKKWELNAGGRYDFSWLKRDSFSPRAAIIYKPTHDSYIKALYGRGFRNPSTYEMFYDDNGLSAMANRALQPERTTTLEIDGAKRLGKRLNLNASVYHYRMNDLIRQRYTDTGLGQFVNANLVRASGASMELMYQLGGLELTSSLEVQRAVFHDGSVLPNSPREVGKTQVTIPVAHNWLTLSGGMQAIGERRSLAGNALPWYIVPEAIVSTRKLRGGFALNGGVRNLSNSYFEYPIALTSMVDSIRADRRAYFLNLEWHGSAEGSALAANNTRAVNSLR